MRIFFGTLIGYNIKIISSSNRNYENVEGIVLDETRNTFVIRNVNNKVLRILKRGSVFKFSLDNNEYIFNGEDLIGDVIKRVVRI